MVTNLNPQALADNWGGILNLSLDSTMTKEKCLEIIKKLDDISQNKFYTINIWDTPFNHYLGSCELLHDYGDHYILKQIYVGNGVVNDIHYTFKLDGQYIRSVSKFNLPDILSRLDVIEQKLNGITENDNIN